MEQLPEAPHAQRASKRSVLPRSYLFWGCRICFGGGGQRRHNHVLVSSLKCFATTKGGTVECKQGCAMCPRHSRLFPLFPIGTSIRSPGPFEAFQESAKPKVCRPTRAMASLALTGSGNCGRRGGAPSCLLSSPNVSLTVSYFRGLFAS